MINVNVTFVVNEIGLKQLAIVLTVCIACDWSPSADADISH